MNPLIALILLALLVFFGLYIFVSVKPATLARAIKTFTTTFAALAGTGLLLTGRFGLALITLIAAMMALRALRTGGFGGGWPGGAPGGFGHHPAGGGQGGRTSDVATDMLAMQLDHRTGDLDGEVLDGQFAGRSLASLGLADLLSLMIECQRDDPRAVPLLETYLDRRHPEWRQQAGAGGESHGQGGEHAAAGGVMDAETARRILGVSPEASADEIKAAHRQLMNKLHPDHGGSSYLAAQLNQARDVLLGR
ncbi:MAG: DnaJ domain-containing protein [Alphaproteobacteria bacterium]|nr:DnaJ domain-containing protein [Alphaproteobacteria bacterium]